MGAKIPSRLVQMERINIVTASDEAFAQHNCVLLASLLSHNPALVFNIFIITPKSFSDESRQKIRNSLSLGSSVLKFCVLRAGSLPHMKVDRHVTETAYYRLLLSEILPSSASLALYLDSDIIINGDISELLTTDLSRHAMAAVPDASADFDASIRKKIGLRKGAHYVNSGVLLINLDL
jgi:lipopolysaccharide biosynthesis glycosyltransferase